MKGGCIPGRDKFKTQRNSMFRWLATDIKFKLLHTGCPITHAQSRLDVILVITQISDLRKQPVLHFLFISCRFPPSKHPVLAFRGAPAAYPMLRQHKSLQRLLQWSEWIEKEANNYIDKDLRPGKFVGIHLRNEEAWVG